MNLSRRPAFERYAAVDWSAASTPTTGADSIWIAELAVGGDVGLTNVSTRLEAASMLTNLVDDSIAAGQRLLIGVDASLGYPRGTARALGFGGLPWRSMWDEIAGLSIDDHRNRNNRFDVAALLNERLQRQRHRPSIGGGPFWGAIDERRRPWLLRTKPNGEIGLPEFRHTESDLRDSGLYPKSVWQLYGAGAVGSQTLTIIPWLHELRYRRGEYVAIWPFDTGLTIPEWPVVVAEVWPSEFVTGAYPSDRVRDAVQVEAVVTAIAAADETAALARWFTPPVAADRRDDVEREEGWIFGPPRS